MTPCSRNFSFMSHADAGRSCGLAAIALLAASSATAALDVSGGVTGVTLYPDDARIEDDRTFSADLNLEWTTNKGRWLAYVEANSSLNKAGASTLVAEANADSGTALDPDRNGRVQLSELNYQFRLAEGAALTAGYLDPSSFLDRSRITNDENVQFLGVSFVNNPTIEFPDYTIGAAYERPMRGHAPQVKVVLASSNGLADNPNLSYSQLIQVSEQDKGAFLAAGVGWLQEKQLIRVGAWRNTRPHSTLDGLEHGRQNYGVYAVYGRTFGRHGLNLRLGIADDEVTEGARFAALAWRLAIGAHAIGIGFAHTGLSDPFSDPSRDDTRQAEVFSRIAIGTKMHITVSAQRIEHSGFVSVASDARSSVRIIGLRFHYAY